MNISKTFSPNNKLSENSSPTLLPKANIPAETYWELAFFSLDYFSLNSYIMINSGYDSLVLMRAISAEFKKSSVEFSF